MRARALILLVALVLARCASVPREAGYDDVGTWLQSRSGQVSPWDAGIVDEAEASRRVRDRLKDGLTVDGALEVALLENRRLRAVYEDLGIAQADWAQAGRLRNPSLDASLRFPETSAGLLNSQVELVGSLLDVVFLPLRKHLAAEQFEAAKLKLAHEVFATLGRVQRQFYEVQAMQMEVALRRTAADAEGASAELALRQRHAGNISELELESRRGAGEDAKLQLARSEQRLKALRESLGLLMGMADSRWQTRGDLAAVPHDEPTASALQALSLKQRLDVAWAQQQARVAEEALDLSKTTRFVGALDVGVSRETGPESGIRVLGPTLHLELPVFDQRQPLIARLEAQARRCHWEAEAAASEAQSQVRMAYDQLQAHRSRVEALRLRVLPSKERSVQLAQQQYNAMLMGIYQVLAAKKDELSAYAEYVEAVRDYWTSRADLEQAVGGRWEEVRR